MERNLQEITAVGKRLEGMDSKIHADIASFHNKLIGLDHRISLVQDKLNTPSPVNEELQYLRDKLTDLGDRSCRDNVPFLVFPEQEGEDVRAFLRNVLPTLTGLTFYPRLSFNGRIGWGPLAKILTEGHIPS
ncbi:hypothetical protein NDU88_006270 [Pleurodeles waltl]|uniref:Uncharacterized protein n=1 Tax=Pleurodeles waltl TaxID=8319 RepID=A0AAV7RM10_PLEWA|nr:hypothetical protein NDU88_006270 [Pleurodeles waltl]